MRPLGLLFLTLFNSILGLSVLFPIIGPLSRELGFSEFQAGLFSTGYALMQFLLAPYWGRRSETLGRRPILLLGIVGFSVGFFLFALFAWLGFQGALSGLPLFVLMLFSRLLGGAFSSATLPTAQAYLADITPRDRRTQNFALLGAAFGLGVVFGPAIGAALSGLGLLVPVLFSASLGLLNALFVYYALPESRRAEERPEVAPRLSWLDPRIWPILLLGFVVQFSSVAMEQTVAFYYQDRLSLNPQQTAQTVGVALVVFGVVAVLIQGFVVRAFKFSPRTLLAIGLPLALLGYVGMVFADSFWTLTLALVLVGAGGAFAGPGTSAAQSLAVSDNEQGAVAGLSSSAQALGRMLGPVLGTTLYGLQPEYPYVFSAALVMVGLVFLVSQRRLGR
ncbi:MAG: MFS transporter [Meiothermus sp.]|nr:MFS transporter [Meiothermus sp.]